MTFQQFYQLCFLLALSDVIAGSLAFYTLRRLHVPFAFKMSWVMLAVAIESLIAILSLWVVTPGIAVNFTAYTTLLLCGRSFKCLTVWWFYFYLLGLCNGKP